MRKQRIFYSEATNGGGLRKMETEILLRKARIKDTTGGQDQKRDVTLTGITIPESISGIFLDEIAQQSKLLPFVHLVRFKGRAREIVGCSINDAAWTEACDEAGEIVLDLREIILDAFKVCGYFAICDTVRDGADPELFNELVSSVGGAIARAIDKAILFGTGAKMPVGICTRLTQTQEPTGWKGTAPAWEDLHSTHVITLDVDDETGAAFFTPISDALAVAEPVLSDDGLFWAMNRKTHRHLLAKAGAYGFSEAAPVMPIIGGKIVDMDSGLIPDNQIIGGYGANYILGERTEMALLQSQHYYFLQDQTVYKAVGHYDGQPAAARSFVVLRYDGTAPTTSASFTE